MFGLKQGVTYLRILPTQIVHVICCHIQHLHFSILKYFSLKKSTFQVSVDGFKVPIVRLKEFNYSKMTEKWHQHQVSI